VALVRVYCGLASTDLNATPPGSVTWLTVAVVDDAGRLLDICDISDDAAGFAELGALLAERSNGLESVAIAADSDDHIVTQLLTAAGRYLAYTDEDSADDYAERFGDDESADEMQSGPAEKRAIGLARALQAGVLSAVAQATPRDLLGLKPVLAAHAAVTTGRQGAAATLREVLRELYPAALRAFPDPAEPIPLAILDALPEPGPLGNNSGGRGRDAQAIAELTEAGVADSATITEAVTALRVAIAETPRRTGMNRSITSAVAETIRQAVAAVRACDAAAGAMVSVLSARMPSASAPAQAQQPARSRRGSGTPAAEPATALRSLSATEEPTRLPRRSRSQSAAVRPRSAPPAAVRPQSAPPASPAAATPAPVAPAASLTPSAPVPPAGFPVSAGAHRAAHADQPTLIQPAATAPPQPAVVAQPPAPAAPPVPVQTASPVPVPVQMPAAPPVPLQAPPAPIPVPPPASVPTPVNPPLQPAAGLRALGGQPVAGQSQPVARPQQVTPVPPPGLTPAYSTSPAASVSSPPTRPYTMAPGPVPTAPPEVPIPTSPAPTSGPPSQSFRVNGGDRYPDPRYSETQPDFTNGGGARPTADVPPPGSRAAWPLVGEAMRDSSEARRTAEPRPYGSSSASSVASSAADARTETIHMPISRPDDFARRDDATGDITGNVTGAGALDPRGADVPRQREGRVTPPWQADDLPAEPPSLRLVEPAPLADPALSGEQPQYRDEFDGRLRFEPPALRLVETNGATNGSRTAAVGGTAERLSRRPAAPPPPPPSAEVPDAPGGNESDGDLLIFAEARSAWFTDHFGEEEVKLEFANPSDEGWRAAERAAERASSVETKSGLPRRVPQENLVPGSPVSAPEDERPLRIVRDAAAIAAHTTGYFRGWRRGQEVGGYRVGGRPGRESTGWDFSRDQEEEDGERGYEYRSARR
jgi:hypothetical protein